MKEQNFFRFKKLDHDYLVVNDLGLYSYLSPQEFDLFANGKVSKIQNKYPQKSVELSDKGFFLEQIALDAFVQKYANKQSFLNAESSLHIIVVTLRCDHGCLYCQAHAGDSKDKTLDMDIVTMKETMDRVFQAASKNLTIEFQGGEPLLNYEVMREGILYAQEKNKQVNKRLYFSVVTNLNSMDQDKLDFFVNNDVSICTSFDGPEQVHNRQRLLLDRNKNSYQQVCCWIKKIKEVLEKANKEYRPQALLTVTKYSLPYYREIIDQYRKLGFNAIHIREMNTFSLNKKGLKDLAFSPEDFVDFYIKSLDYILELNKAGEFFFERGVGLVLTKIFTEYDPNYMDMRSPCGAGIGQIAYNYNGDVYTCDEARMLSRLGDESFCLGSVKNNSFAEFVGHPTVKAMCVASCLDNLPGCSVCVYKPYCGVCPLISYIEIGNIFTQPPKSRKCFIQKSIFDYLFRKLKEPEYEKIFKSWVQINGGENV